MTHELAVWLFADRIGTLASADGRLSFCYAPGWLAQADAVPLSQSLPLQAEAYDDRKTRPFFAGLLPEGQMRRLLARQLQVSGQNDFALLDRIGGECAGAVSLLNPEQPLPASTQVEDIQWLSDGEVVAILDELPHRPMLAGQDGLRLSLAGAQDKLPVVFDGKRLGLPRNGAPSSHILKPAIPSVEDSVINEGFCLALAAAMRLQVAKASVHTVMNRPFLLVERYDRIVDDAGCRQRLHQEDFCQALGVAPEMKYQNEAGPDLQQCFQLVRQVTRPSAPQILRLLDDVIFNALIGNHDAHAKNFSLLYAGNTAVLAPLYDALSTAVYAALTPKMAMKIGSKYTFSEVGARHWSQFAQAAGVSGAQTRKRLLQWAKSLPLTARKLQADPQYRFSDKPVVERIIRLIEDPGALTLQRLSA